MDCKPTSIIASWTCFDCKPLQLMLGIANGFAIGIGGRLCSVIVAEFVIVIGGGIHWDTKKTFWL